MCRGLQRGIFGAVIPFSRALRSVVLVEPGVALKGRGAT